MNAASGGSRLRAPTSATSCGCTEPSSIAMRSGMPHAFPEGEVSGVLRSPWLSSQTTASLPARRANPRIAPTCAAAASSEHERSLGQVGRLCLDLLRKRVALDHTRLGVRQSQQRRGGHGLTPVTPGSGDADEPGRILASAAVTLVVRTDRDRGERTAVGTFRPQAAHGVCDGACGRTRRDPATAVSRRASGGTRGMRCAHRSRTSSRRRPRPARAAPRSGCSRDRSPGQASSG